MSDERTLRFTFEGAELAARPGWTIAAALVAAGIPDFGIATDGTRRGVFCGIGACHDCLVAVDGRGAQRACMTPVANGAVVQRLGAANNRRSVDLTALPDRPPDTEHVEVVVIGGGPAGLSAAISASKSGARVVLLDERSKAGGQYFKQPAAAIASDLRAKTGAALIERAAQRVDIRTGTLVWGAWRDADGIELATFDGRSAGRLRPKALVIATGANEIVRPLPGWTLPGVSTTGAAQTLLRAHGVPPGKRVLIAGNGPLNLDLAVELASAGVAVVAVVEASDPPWTRPGPGMALVASDLGLTLSGLKGIATLAAKGVALHWRSRLLRIEGTDRVTGAVIGDPVRGEHRVEIDAVCINDGFSPANELSRLLGCRHRPGPDGLEAERDDDGATSVGGVFIVGEAGGFGGAHVAMAQGTRAGQVVAHFLGRPLAKPRPSRLRRHRRFQRALWTLFARDGDGLDAASPDTIVCRCECLPLSTLRSAVERHAISDLPTLKRLTRAGMGRCQGRFCAASLAALVGLSTSEAHAFAPQAPVRPIPLPALALEKGEWGGHRRVGLPELRPRAAATTTPPVRADILVIGGGIAGLSSALFLARGGAEVVVIDAGRPGAMASGGNAGSLHAQLLSFDYGWKAESGGGTALRTLPLQLDSIALWRALEQEFRADFEIVVTGGLMVASNEDEIAFLEEKSKAERGVGIDSRVIGRAELARLEPALDDGLAGAALCGNEGKINPLPATQAVLEAAIAAGTRVYPGIAATAIERGADGFEVLTSSGPIRAARIVNAAGAFAGKVGAMLGIDVPVHGAPLQMIVTEPMAPITTRLLAHAGRHLTLKQARNGTFIIGGGWPAGLDPVHGHPRPLRDSIEGNLWSAQSVVPALRGAHVVRTWAAMNINIDGAPILGEDPAVPGLFHAVTSNGFTLGPIVGEITAGLVLGRKPAADFAAFSRQRFIRS